MKKWSYALVIIFALSLVMGCGQKEYKPAAIVEGVDVCVVCNMLIKDDAFATQIVTKDGKYLKFDDLGDMNVWKQKNGLENIGMDYVRDYNDKEWIEFSKATYVYDKSLRTPMAYGVISFKDKASAEAFIKEQGVGQIMAADQLSGHTWEHNNEMMDMGGMHGDHSDEMHKHEGEHGHQ